MAEMKCPACGQRVTFIAFTNAVGCELCNFTCHVSDLPRLNEAMELLAAVEIMLEYQDRRATKMEREQAS